MKTFHLLQKAEKTLRSSSIDSPKLETELLLSHLLGCSRIDLHKKKYDDTTEEKAFEFLKLIERRKNLEPIAHLIGTREFMEYDFKVTKDTLIPRPETELLVTAVAKYLQSLKGEHTALDLGTGSGCIALCLAKKNPQLKITAIDFSEAALEVAKENAKNLAISQSQISFLKKDVLKESFWEELPKFQILVSNPPYIGIKEKIGMAKDVLNFEPESALFAPSEGLEFYKCFAKNAKKLLKEDGRIFLELSPIIYDSVIKIFEENAWNLLQTITDYSGHKRHIILS